MANPKEAAERYESLANEYTKRARGLEGLRRKPKPYHGRVDYPNYHERIEELHRKASIMYQKAAEEWERTGRIKKAIADYRNSEEYAWRPGDKDRLSQIIEKLSQRRSFFSLLSIIFLIASLFFVSFRLTGNAIVNLSSDNLTLAGTGLFVLGLVFAFFYIQEKKR
jgi:hypothetical protein